MMTKMSSRISFFFLKIAYLFAIIPFIGSGGSAWNLKIVPEIELSQIVLTQQTEKKGDEPVDPEIFLIDYEGKGRLKIGLYFKIEPGWYLYWLNPGEAGLPPQVEWKLPPGFSLSSLEFPTPEKFLSSGYVVYGYKNELLLLACFLTPEGFSIPTTETAVIKAKLNWMVCRESCLIGESELELDLSSIDSKERKKSALIWEKFKSRFPRPAEEIRVQVKNVKMVKDDEGESYKEIKISLELEGEDLLQVKDFYPLPLEDFIINETMTKYDAGTIEMCLIALKNEARIDRLRGLLIGEKSSYLVNFSLPDRPRERKIFSNGLKIGFLQK